MGLKAHYKSVVSRINSENVELLAVSKKQPIEKIEALYKIGHKLFGENYVQEAIVKIEELTELDIQWHFIGPIQSNKTKHIAKHFDWVQSVDTIKILARLNNQRGTVQEPLNVLLQLKVGGEDSKRGFNVEEILEVCSDSKTYENIVIRGLMSIPAPTTVYQEQLAQFNQCKEVFQSMKKILPVDTLSMGMSGDLEAAIECGSTMVRIGTDIFGAREI